MQRITGDNLAAFINQLPKNKEYNYLYSGNRNLIRIVGVEMPEGPIIYKRWDPSKGETLGKAKTSSISTQSIWRLANSFSENHPVNVDRIFGASGNFRSVLEALVAHTPQFYYCYPGRIEDIAGNTKIRRGQKHLIWIPSAPHRNAIAVERKSNVAVSEIPVKTVSYDLVLPTGLEHAEIDIDVARRHTQIQIALYLIGLHLGFRTWIAQNDKGIIYNDKPLIEQNGIVKTLRDEPMVYPHEGAVQAGLFVDCIWFQNNRLMPAVMEVEHSTGVTGGLMRMLNLQAKLPRFHTRYVIVAADDDRRQVIKESSKEVFKPLNVRYFPYSAVEELYYLCEKRNLSRESVKEEFLDCFMEKT